jgi:hypothetical protein
VHKAQTDFNKRAYRRAHTWSVSVGGDGLAMGGVDQRIECRAKMEELC